ncbi:MAG: LysR family transcriptional regulator [Clostridia bacterium]|nr:LysR family transcriptional regulator [Clostridia bacterium]
MDDNLNLYKYFLAVIKERSVSGAAKRLGVSQPTVSYNIHVLQRELGEQLFTIERNGIVPTRHAILLYQRLQPIYVSLVQTIEDFRQIK